MGEELSNRLVAALEWSPPGLAKHRRCSLAVLTSNHVLSIWECMGQPESRDNWRRALIINRTLQKHFANGKSEQNMPLDEYERYWTQQRVRAFTWAPALRATSGSHPLSAYTTWGEQYIAVSNDCGDILILKITSPYDVLDPQDNEWKVSIVYTFRVEPIASESFFLGPCLPQTTLWKPHLPFADQLTWSPWVKDASGESTSFLAFATTADVSRKQIYAGAAGDKTELEFKATVSVGSGMTGARPAGPLQWAPKPYQGRLYLVMFFENCILCDAVSPAEPTRSSPSGLLCHDFSSRWLDGTWDEISGGTRLAPTFTNLLTLSG